MLNEQEADENEEVTELPQLQEKEILSLSSMDLLEEQSKPKPLHTENSLLAAMESAGRN